MNGYGAFVWSSFVITFVVCTFVYYKTQNFKKYEKEFAKEIEELSTEKRKSQTTLRLHREFFLL